MNRAELDLRMRQLTIVTNEALEQARYTIRDEALALHAGFRDVVRTYEARIATLTSALKPLAELSVPEDFTEYEPEELVGMGDSDEFFIKRDDIRAARRALKPSPVRNPDAIIHSSQQTSRENPP